MTLPPARPFGRTAKLAPVVWIDHGNDIIEAGEWLAVIVDREDLDRKGYERVQARLSSLPRRPDVLITRNIIANDIKAGWPLHRLQQFRDRGACRYFAVETTSPLEAEWIAANAPIHAVVLPFHREDMSARYRVFDVAANAGVALLGRAHSPAEAALHLATPALHGTIVQAGTALTSIEPLAVEQAEEYWRAYAAQHPEPPKLRSGHPPDEGA
ncbi:MAG: hypothetical protein ACTHM6_05720 [Tepidisphaeraceae bacterium]